MFCLYHCCGYCYHFILITIYHCFVLHLCIFSSFFFSFKSSIINIVIISFIFLSLSLLQLLSSLCLNYHLSLYCSLFIHIFHFFLFLIDSFLLILAISRFNTDSIFSKSLKRCNAVLFLETNCASLNPREYYHYATKSIIQIYFPTKIYIFFFFLNIMAGIIMTSQGHVTRSAITGFHLEQNWLNSRPTKTSRELFSSRATLYPLISL